MYNKKLLLALTAFVFLFSSIQFSQEKEEEEKSDSAEADQEWWDNDDWDDFDFDFDLFDNYKSPSVSLTYGFSSINIHNFSGSFTDPNIPQLKLGYTTEKTNRESDGILDYKYNYLFLSNIRTDISGTPGAKEIESNMWRIGFGWAKGYGYDLGSAAIIPYNSYSLAWSRLDVKNFPDNQEDADKLALYNEAFRFGTGSEAGLRIQVIPQVTFEAAYERSVIFERHLFWKWAGSVLIEGAGHWALDSFVDRIMDSSPYAAPVVGFILKSALSYGVYELRQEKMNWPFKSAAPIGYDQYKFGVTFNF